MHEEFRCFKNTEFKMCVCKTSYQIDLGFTKIEQVKEKKNILFQGLSLRVAMGMAWRVN